MPVYSMYDWCGKRYFQNSEILTRYFLIFKVLQYSHCLYGLLKWRNLGDNRLYTFYILLNGKQKQHGMFCGHCKTIRKYDNNNMLFIIFRLEIWRRWIYHRIAEWYNQKAPFRCKQNRDGHLPKRAILISYHYSFDASHTIYSKCF